MMLAPRATLSAVTVPMSDGSRGLHQTLQQMRRLVREGRVDPTIRAAAGGIVFLIPQKDEYAEAESLYKYVRDSIRYVKDVHEVETLATAVKTLETRFGDCDDQTVLLASMLEAIGHPTRFVVAAYQQQNQMEHVYLQVLVDGQWIDCDPTEPECFGWAPPGAVTLMIERV